jgi:hypothetical protein
MLGSLHLPRSGSVGGCHPCSLPPRLFRRCTVSRSRTTDQHAHYLLGISRTLWGTPIAHFCKSQPVQSEYGFPDTMRANRQPLTAPLPVRILLLSRHLGDRILLSSGTNSCDIICSPGFGFSRKTQKPSRPAFQHTAGRLQRMLRYSVSLQTGLVSLAVSCPLLLRTSFGQCN